jgi:hypothetical protein
MPSPWPATSASSCLVVRHGAQKAEENCSKVTRVPSGWPRSASVSRRAGDSRIRPSRRRQANPKTVPRTRTAPSTTTPATTIPTARPAPAAFPGATPSRARESSSAPGRAPACYATALGPYVTPRCRASTPRTPWQARARPLSPRSCAGWHRPAMSRPGTRQASPDSSPASRPPPSDGPGYR